MVRKKVELLLSKTTAVRLVWVTAAVVIAATGSCKRCADPKQRIQACRLALQAFSFTADGLHTQLRFSGYCPEHLPLRPGNFRYLKSAGLLEGPVTLTNRTGRTAYLVAAVDFLSDGDGNRRFEPQVDSFWSVVSGGKRGFWYGRLRPGQSRTVNWRFRLPQGRPAPTVRGAGRIIALHRPDLEIVLQPEDLLAGQGAARFGRTGWAWEVHHDGYSGWAVVAGRKPRAPLRGRFRVPRTDTYRVLIRRPGLRIPALKVDDRAIRVHGRGPSAWREAGAIPLRKGLHTLTILPDKRKWMRLDAVALVPAAKPRPHWMNRTPSKPLSALNARAQLPTLLRTRLLTMRNRVAQRVRSLDEWKAEAERIRATLRRNMDWPSVRAKPPRHRTAGRVKGNGFEVIKLFIEGFEGIWASALLYRPHPLASSVRYPAVLHLLGHYGPGKLRRSARILNAHLARLGFVVLSVDNLSMGERKGPPGRTRENHHYLGFWHVLAGSSPARVIYGEGLRMLEFLRSRPEVDPERIAATGSSGGGLASLYLAALDKRIAAVAAVASVTTWEHGSNFAGGDPEQYPFGIARTADFPTLLGLVAPRPLLAAAGTRDDLFPPKQASDAVQGARRVYQLYGAQSAIEFFQDGGPHGYQAPRRKAVCRFLSRVLARKAADCREDPRIALPAQRLRTGPAPSTRTFLDEARSALTRKGATPGRIDKDVRTRLARILGVGPGGEAAASVEHADPIAPGSLPGEPVVLRVGPQQVLPGRLMRPEGKVRGVVLYVSDAGVQSAVFAPLLARARVEVLALNLSGFGALSPHRRYRFGLARVYDRIDNLLHFHDIYGAQYLNALGDSLWGLRVREILAAAAALRRRFKGAKVAVLGQGTECGVYALTAAALDPKISAVLSVDGLLNFRFNLKQGKFPPSGLVARGFMRLTDVAGLAAVVAPRPLTWLGGRTADGKPQGFEARRYLAETRRAFLKLRASSRLEICGSGCSFRKAVERWIRKWAADSPSAARSR